MAKTRHIQQRMSQRAIQQAMLDMVVKFGKSQGDKVILNRKGIDAVLMELEKLKKQALRAREKGGLVIVGVDDAMITTYALNSYKHKYH